MYSFLAVCAMGYGITKYNETWTSIKKSKIKCVVYLSAVICFLICLLIAFDIIPLMDALYSKATNRTASGLIIVLLIGAIIIQIVMTVVVIITANKFNKAKRDKEYLERIALEDDFEEEILEEEMLDAETVEKMFNE